MSNNVHNCTKLCKCHGCHLHFEQEHCIQEKLQIVDQRWVGWRTPRKNKDGQLPVLGGHKTTAFSLVSSYLSWSIINCSQRSLLINRNASEWNIKHYSLFLSIIISHLGYKTVWSWVSSLLIRRILLEICKIMVYQLYWKS